MGEDGECTSSITSLLLLLLLHPGMKTTQ
jgi:hypothetical protein